MSTERQFFCVWGTDPSCHIPRFRHDNYWGAENEAMRLARENPGKRFVVLKSQVAFEVSDPLHRVEFDDDIPF